MSAERFFTAVACLVSFCQSASPETIYRWMEADGSVRMTRTQPKLGFAYETFEVPDPIKWINAPSMPGEVDEAAVSSTQNIFKALSNSVYGLTGRQHYDSGQTRGVSYGSAVAITSKLAITNCHVLEDAGENIFLGVGGSGEAEQARLVGANCEADRCVISVSTMDLHPVPGVRRFESLKIGETVYAIGNPLKLDRTLSQGLLSGKRELRERPLPADHRADLAGLLGWRPVRCARQPDWYNLVHLAGRAKPEFRDSRRGLLELAFRRPGASRLPAGSMTVLTTRRLRLEPFDESHLAGLRAINADAEVMRYITGRPETEQETRAAIERVKARWIEWGFSWWSFIEPASGEIIGAGCIQHLGRDPANPLEIGWRVRRDRWRQGFASEAAVAMARFAFESTGADRLCAVCRPENLASARVMQRLGMQYRGMQRWYEADMKVFEITRGQWEARHASAMP